MPGAAVCSTYHTSNPSPPLFRFVQSKYFIKSSKKLAKEWKGSEEWQAFDAAAAGAAEGEHVLHVQTFFPSPYPNDDRAH